MINQEDSDSIDEKKKARDFKFSFVSNYGKTRKYEWKGDNTGMQRISMEVTWTGLRLILKEY